MTPSYGQAYGSLTASYNGDGPVGRHVYEYGGRLMEG